MTALRSQVSQSVNCLALCPHDAELDPLPAKGKGIMVWRVR
jgi:hypothetical protein